MAGLSKKVPAPLTPKVVEIVSAEQLLPVARLIVKRKGYPFHAGLQLKTGMKVLMIVDSTNDRLVQEAFSIAIKEAGGKLEIITLHGYPELKEPIELVDTMFSRQWWPGWVWKALESADIIMQGAMLIRAYTPNLPKDTPSKSPIVTMGWPADILGSNYETFPIEVRDVINEKTWELLCYAREILLSDAEGTELRITLNREEWEDRVRKDLKTDGVPYKPDHLMIPLPSKNLEGTLVCSSVSFGGTVPRTFMTIKGGQVTEVEGGGKFGEVLWESFEKYKNLAHPALPGKGINWVNSLGIHTNPKAMRSALWDKFSGSGRMHAWAFGHLRSGTFHISIGQGLVSREYNIVRHIDQYFPTLIADGKTIIDRGHMIALDAPEVRKVAEKFGDPDKLLAEDWIPAISGVNAP